MARILCFVESISLCHLARLVHVAQIVRQAGHDVTFACGASHLEHVRSFNFEAHEVPTVHGPTVYARLRALKPTYHYDELEAYLRFDEPFVAKLRPDAIVFDMRLTMPLVGAKLGIPTLSVSNGIYHPDVIDRRSAPMQVAGRIPLPQHWMDRMYRSAIGRAVEPFFERPFSRPLDRLYIKHGGQPLGTFARYLSGGDVAMLADLPELAPLHARTTNAVHIGPCLWEPPSTLAGPELDLGSGDQPLVYFSLGSSVFPDELVSPTVAGLLGNGFRVLLQCGHRDVRGLPADDRLIVRAFVNNRQAMRRASVAITHGGVSTSYEAILEGSPFIALPSFTDQQWNTDVFVAAGVAAMVSPQAGGASAVIHRVQRMHEDEQPRGAAESLATSIRRFDASVAVNLALDTALGHSSAHVERRRSA